MERNPRIYARKQHTKPAKRAATEPPPGAEVRAPTLKTNFSTESRVSGPTLMMFIRYSIILSLKRTKKKYL